MNENENGNNKAPTQTGTDDASRIWKQILNNKKILGELIKERKELYQEYNEMIRRGDAGDL